MSDHENDADKKDEEKHMEIHRVGLKTPPFWPQCPEIWFAQIEAQFVTAQVKTDASKFNTVVGAIESNVLCQVSAAVLNPPTEDKYGNLKKLIIDRFSDSAQSKMRKLLSEMSLGDQKPSNLLNEMKRLGGTSLTEEFLKTLWLQNLPVHARAILSTSEVDLNTLATLADKIIEVGGFTNIQSVNAKQSSSTPIATAGNSDSRFEVLEKRIAQLTKSIEKMHVSRSRSRARSSNRRFNSRRNSTPASSTSTTLCWYHEHYGEKANRCRGPCTYVSTKN